MAQNSEIQAHIEFAVLYLDRTWCKQKISITTHHDRESDCRAARRALETLLRSSGKGLFCVGQVLAYGQDDKTG